MQLAHKRTPKEVHTILGIDPGYHRIGWSIGTTQQNYTLIAAGCIETLSSDSIFVRYATITAELEKILTTYKPTQAAIETLFFSKNTSTALRVSEARGILIATILSHTSSISEYNPVEIKQAVTGSGAANKAAVEKMVGMQVRLPKEVPLIDDAIDAIAIGITHAVIHIT